MEQGARGVCSLRKGGSRWSNGGWLLMNSLNKSSLYPLSFLGFCHISSATERSQMYRQLANMRKALFDQGFLDEQFVQLEELQDDANPNFVEEIVTLFYRDSTRLIHNIEQPLEKSPLDFTKLDSYMHQLKGSTTRPFPPPPQSTFGPPPDPNPLPPPPQPQGNQYSQNWGYSGRDGSYNSQNYSQAHANSGFQHGPYGSSSSSSQHYGPSGNQFPPPPPPPNHPQQQPQYPYPLPPPPPESSYPPPPPPLSQNSMNLPPAPTPMYFPSSQYLQFNHQPLQPPPPPPPSSPPPSSMFPPPPPPPSQPPSPPPPPSSAPTGGRTKENRADGEKGAFKDVRGSGWREPGHLNHGAPPKQHKPPVPHLAAKKSNGPSGRIETEEERRLRKKRELEKQKQEEKHRQAIEGIPERSAAKDTNVIFWFEGAWNDRHRAQLIQLMYPVASKPCLALSACSHFPHRFRNELPDPTAQPKLLSLRRDKDRFTKYTITSLEKMHKPRLYVEPDLGIPLDLLDLSVYNPPKGEKLPLDPADELLLQDDDPVTPIKKDGIKRKDRPTDKGVSWLVKTQYISPLSMEAAKQSLTEKQAKELREARGGRNILDNFNNRERRIKEIEASFEACKSRPVHSTNSKLQPVEVLPLLPDFERYEDQFVIVTFDGAPTADSEVYSKLDKSVRDAHESRAIMKSYVATGSDSAKPDKFLAYMAPSRDEVRGDVADDPTTYLVAFGESEARYAPLPTKLILRKKRAKEGKSSDEVEHFPVPARVTVRRRSTVAAVEVKDPESYPAPKRARLDVEDGFGRRQRDAQDEDMDQSSGGEYMSD
ncbi:hydroxyproline-rich glycoprotein family protein [Actinidia rufa]|uniref:Hydroxyproline-rich glycoprotein family protein n=1 Tax=Actinidia rufa TaxID=165716 RepID=A0A7J0FF70_9ERIC|nr:hydroxyproline-rich glycoprotein family protein [Actinidia rufa]